MEKILARTEKTKACWYLIAIAFGFFLLRLPSLFEPYWYGDEGIYQVIGNALHYGRLLYTGIWDNKPPLLYVLYAIFSGDQFWVRAASLLSGLCAVFSFFALAKQIFNKQEKIQLITTALFAFLFGIPLLEGNIANAENFMLFPIILAGFLIYRTQNYTLYARRYTLFLAGFLLSLAFLFKVVGIFDFAAFTFFLLLTKTDRKKWSRQDIAQLFSLGTGFVFPIILTALVFVLHETFSDFITATLKQNVGYVGYGNTLLIPQGFLLLKLFGLFLVTAYLFIKRKILPPAAIFLALWFSFSLFNAFFSGRPYTHYLLVLLPSFCLTCGVLFTLNSRYKKTIAIILFITLVLVIKNFTLYNKTVAYYQNYLSFIFNKKSVTAYQNFFDPNTPADYAVASFLALNLQPNDTIFVWGDTPGIYALTKTLPPGRYIVAYHITSSEAALMETQHDLESTNPRYIIQTSKEAIPFPMQNYKERFVIYNIHIYERGF